MHARPRVLRDMRPRILLRLRKLPGLAVLLLLAASPALAPALAQHPGLTTPREAPALMAAATAAGDTAALASLYAGDATLLSPQGLTFNGRAAIRAAFAANHAAGPNRLTFSDVRLDGDEQRAIMMTVWTLAIEPRGQPAVELRGRSVWYFRHTQAGWVIVLDIYQNLPPTPAPTAGPPPR